MSFPREELQFPAGPQRAQGIREGDESPRNSANSHAREPGISLPAFGPDPLHPHTPATVSSPLVPSCPVTLWGLGYQGVLILQGRPSHPAVLGSPWHPTVGGETSCEQTCRPAGQTKGPGPHSTAGSLPWPRPGPSRLASLVFLLDPAGRRKVRKEGQ